MDVHAKNNYFCDTLLHDFKAWWYGNVVQNKFKLYQHYVV